MMDMSGEKSVTEYSHMIGSIKGKSEKSSCLMSTSDDKNHENVGAYSNQKNTANLTTAESVALSFSGQKQKPGQ